MRHRRSIRSRRARRRIAVDFDLQLTSMLDILVIVLVFLLKAFASTAGIATPPLLQLPVSQASEAASGSVQVVISREAILIENQIVARLEKLEIVASDSLPGDAARIEPLYRALEKQHDLLSGLKAEYAPGTSEEKAFVGSLAIQADRAIPYETIRKVLYTSALAGFRSYRLVAVRK